MIRGWSKPRRISARGLECFPHDHSSTRATGSRRGDSDDRDLHPRRFWQSLVDRRSIHGVAVASVPLIEGFGDFTGAAAVSTILLVLALGHLAKLRIEGNRSYVTISGKATSIPRPPIPRALTAACFIACLALAGLILMVYGVLIVSALTVSFPYNLGFTMKHFEYLGSHSQSLINSLQFGGIAAIICALFAMLLAFLVQRKEWWGRNVVDFIAIMPAAVPGLFFGIGYATAFNQRIFDWIDRGTLITISMIFWNIPVGYQAAIAGLQQIDRSLDEAATSLGASSAPRFSRYSVPDAGQCAAHRLCHCVRPRRDDALGRDFPVHAQHNARDDYDFPTRERFQLGRLDRVHGIADWNGGDRVERRILYQRTTRRIAADDMISADGGRVANMNFDKNEIVRLSEEYGAAWGLNLRGDYCA